MSSRSTRLVALMFIAALVTALSADAQSAVRLGSELQVNSRTANQQRFPDVALDADGDFVVTWQSFGQDGEYEGVFVRRFNAAGIPQASELQVNQRTIGYQRSPAIAVDSDGDFVVSWRSYDGSFDGVFVRRFDSAGVAQAGEFQVNTYTTGFQRFSEVALDANGDFVVVWDSFGQDGASYGVFARRFNALGGALGGEFQVNTYTNTTQFYPSVAVDGDGDFVVAWSSAHDGFEYGIFARRFNAAGTPQGTEFQVNTHTTSEQRRPTVSIGAQGSFVVAWQSFGQDGYAYGIFAQRFDSTGAPQGAELQVNIVTAGFQVAPDLAADSSGGFVVTWHSSLQDGSSYGIFGRVFNAAGAPLGGDFQVNSYTAGSQRFSAVALRGGDFVVAWHSEAQDGSLEGIFAQRLATLAILDIDGNGATAPLTDGLLVLRFLFGFTGTTLTAGAVGQGCTRCDAPAIVAYLQTLV